MTAMTPMTPMTPHPISTYAAIGTICGGTAGVVHAIADGGSLVVALVLASLSGAIAGAGYGYVRLRRAARR
jgi:hypothetical protein